MDSKKLLQLKDSVVRLVQDCADNLLKYYGNIEADIKSDTGFAATDIVTKLDRDTERFLSDELAKIDPTIGFRGEEFGVEREADTSWLVDPIDGTNHFVKGLPFCTTMVSLVHEGEVVISVINDFVRGDTYWAVKGEGSHKNDERIHISKTAPKNSVVFFESHLELNDNHEFYNYILGLISGIMITMNCGFEFAMIASGKIDAKITKDPYGKDWDFAAGSLLVQEAGGVVKNLESEKYDYTNHDFFAGTPQLYSYLTGSKINTIL